MTAISRQVGIWTPPGQRPSAGALGLAGMAGALGGARALAQWQTGHPDAAVAYAHGERHDLWWEFDLTASFQWQAHVSRLNPFYGQQRLIKLAHLFDLTDLLRRPVESLTPGEQARANLAVALLPQPDLLVWEEPFRAMPGREWMQLCRVVRRLCRAEGLTVIMVAESKEETHDVRQHETWADHSRTGRRPGVAGRRAAAAGALWP